MFVRELIQNARDAGARCVWLTADRSSLGDRVICRDDGEGMGFDVARGFLFTLYASSKADVAHNAGRFGVGFWSVLRFAPEVITIRSRTAGGDGWEVRLDGSLELLGQRSIACNVGTTVILERRVATPDLEARVRRAVLEDAPFVRRRGRRGERLAVFVNEQPVARELALEPPSSVFERPGLRGAVALASEPRVDLFAFGLRVRTAASLDDLTTDGVVRDQAETLPGGVAPRALLDSDRLQVLLARSDAAEDRELARVVHTARDEVGRLVRRHLDHLAPLPVLRRLVSWAPLRLRRRRTWIAVGVLTAALVIGVGLGMLLRGMVRGGGGGNEAVGLPPQIPVPYTDPGREYGGPTVDPLAVAVPAVALTYAPPTQDLLIGAVKIAGWPNHDVGDADPPPSLRPHPSAPCEAACIEFGLVVSAPAGRLRLPVPTGHLVDPLSVMGEGQNLAVALSPAGETVIDFDAPFEGALRYRTGPGTAPEDASPGRWPSLPPDIDPEVRALEGLSFQDLLRRATELVARRVQYDTSADVARRLAEARESGLGVLDCALSVGAGDCDVQNVVLAAALSAAGVESRLVIGLVGRRGSVVSGLHAWAEAQAEDGRWWVADASTIGRGGNSDGGVGSDSETVVEPSQESRSPSQGGERTLRRWLSQFDIRRSAWLGATLVGLVVLAVVAIRRLRGGRRRIELGGGVELAAVLEGVIHRPSAFGDVRAIESRPLVPTVAGDKVSVARARSLAAEHRLFRSAVGQGHAASGRRWLVVDAAKPEGRVVADLLGAVDVDRWNALLERSYATSVTEAVSAAVAARGESWRMQATDGMSEPIAVIETGVLTGESGELVLVAADGRLLEAAATLHPHAPARAVLLLADAALNRLSMPSARRAKVLGALARQAASEEVGDDLA